jgi:hypothetical protein
MINDLEDVKEGDILGIYGFNSLSYTVKVARVTKTLIILDNGSRYRKDGYEVGTESYWSVARLVKITPEMIQQLKHRKLVLTMEKVNWSKVTLENLEAIKDILDQNFKPKDV